MSCALANGTAKKVWIKNICLQAEVVDSDLSRQAGLMFRKELGKDQAMLFVFPQEARYSFWMKNMRFPLDIIWIDQDKIIVDIKNNIPPCQQDCKSFAPQSPAKYVLEVNSGWVQKNRIQINDKVKF